MIKVKVKKGQDINKVLKVFKRRVNQTGMMKELRQRQSFTKKSVKKRETFQKAKYVESLNLEL
jgi:small subunit ribosomal protein S21|tara:strand:+ start:287 stop:475 length:189 start_codon:yes stop_codon:yes gene_type:complete